MPFPSRKTSLNGGNAVDHAAQAPSSLLPPEERYLDVRQTASRYSSSPTTLWRWVKTRPDFPSPVKIGPGCTRWRLSDLLEFERRMGAAE